MKKKALIIISRYEEKEREEARMKRAEGNEDEGRNLERVDEAIAGPSCSRDTFLYLPKKLDFGYLGVPSTSSQSSFTEQLSSPEQLECKREDENEDNEPEMPHGTIILLR
ncbi:hypothetical protein TNCV_2964491 [Trichonephila clavipes]|nr:hypothetical protein TNCV_2964491 [Trichonephila clavipes]